MPKCDVKEYKLKNDVFIISKGSGKLELSKQYLIEVFKSIKQCPIWSLQVLQFKHTIRDGLKYASRQIAIEPEERLREYINKISTYYSDTGLDKFESVDNYTGDFVNNGIYKLNKFVNAELTKLLSVIATPDVETPLQEFDSNALLFKGTIREDLEDKSVIIVSMQKPTSFLTNKFRFVQSNKKFHEIDDLVLTLRSRIDVLIVGSDVYLMGLAGEKLFHLDGTARAICKTKTEEISDCGFFSDSESFKYLAQRGHNRRRFLAYNEKHFEALKDLNLRKDMSAKFGFPLDDEDNIKTDEVKAVKYLCDKGMIDPVDGNPKEVANSKPWVR